MALLQISEPGGGAKARRQVVGIDLGTTHSVIATVTDGQAVVLSDSNGRTLFPSAVSYLADGSAIVGEAALAMAEREAVNTLTSVKRLMGRTASDLTEAERQALPAVADEHSIISLQTAQGSKTPQEISAEILRYLLKIANTALAAPVEAAVITVPAYFDDTQRQATADAAALAGIEVLRLINEPTAAALSYGLECENEGLIAVYDLGGGTFDISLLQLREGFFQVLATAGNTRLGGDDFDLAVATELARRAGLNLSQLSQQRYRSLLGSARKLREQLSESERAEYDFEGLSGCLTREELNRLLAPLVENTLEVCRQCVADAGLAVSAIDKVVLAGGATRTPLVRERVEALFQAPLFCDLNPDQVVAVGAAYQAAALNGEGRDDSPLLLDVLPLSLGVEVMGGLMEPIIPRNTPIPVTMARDFTTAKDGQNALSVHVFQGERDMVADCRSLAHFVLRGIPSMAAGTARIRVSFGVDADGLLTVSAEEQTTGVQSQIEVRPSSGLSREMVEQMLEDAFSQAGEDREQRALAESRSEAEQLLEQLTAALAAEGQELLSGQQRKALESAMEALKTQLATADRAAIERAHKELDEASALFAERRMDAALKRALVGRRALEEANS